MLNGHEMTVTLECIDKDDTYICFIKKLNYIYLMLNGAIKRMENTPFL
jgi:hypothetical protein